MKKIGEIKGVPVVEGNINEVTKNQIHYKEDEGSIQLSKRGYNNKLNSITSGSSESLESYNYYKLNKDASLGDLTGLIMVIGWLNTSCIIKGKEMTNITLQHGSNTELCNWFLAFMTYPSISADMQAFKCLSTSENIVLANNPNNSGNFEYTIINTTGDLYSKIITVLQNTTDEGDVGDLKELENMLKSVIISITKEEYESMLN